MRRLFPLLRWFWGAVVCAIIIGTATNRLFGPIHDEAWAFLLAHWALLSLGLLGIGGLTLWSWRDKRRRERQEATQKRWQGRERERQEWAEREHLFRQHFVLFKPATELRPEDLGFQRLKQGDVPAPRHRPHYQVYISRRAVPYRQISQKEHERPYDEHDLAQALQQGQGIILLGQPLDGKSRTVYEIVKRLEDYDVVRPTDNPTPPDEVFSIFRGHRIILLLEDLNSYARGVPDLLEFCAKIHQYAEAWAVIATCRDGPELGAVKEAIGTSLRRFYADIPLKLGLLPLTTDEKKQLAQGIGTWRTPQDSDISPTPGFITMQAPLEIMRDRFQSLRPDYKDTLRGLKLLAAAGILPFTHHRLQAILNRLFNRTLHFGDCLDILAEQSFIRRPARQDPIRPEPAYLRDVVEDIEGRPLEGEFPVLIGVLEEIADTEGLFYLGNTYALSLKNQEALNIYERVLHMRPNAPVAWYNTATVLALLERDQEALEAFEQTIQLYPDFAEAWAGKGTVLGKLRGPIEALEAYNRAIQLRPNFPEVGGAKGDVLARLERYEEALEAFERVVHFLPDDVQALDSKGRVLTSLGRYREALEVVEQILHLQPNAPEALLAKGATLLALRCHQKALQTLERLLDLHPDNARGWAGKADVLVQLGCLQKALEAYNRAIEFRPDFSEAWAVVGLHMQSIRFQLGNVWQDTSLKFGNSHGLHNK